MKQIVQNMAAFDRAEHLIKLFEHFTCIDEVTGSKWASRRVDRSSCRKYLSGCEKRKRKREIEEKDKNLPKISSYLKNKDLNKENLSEQCSKSEDFNLSKSISELPDAAPNTSDYLNSETPQQGTSKLYFCMEKIISSPYVTDKGNFIDLNDQVKRFIIENGHCRPKGPFLKNSDNRSFSEKHYYIISKSGVKLERTWLSYSLKLQKAYCEPCWLFANRACRQLQNVWIEGFDDWKHIVEAIQRHEISKIHLDSCITYQQWRLHGTLDERHESAIKKEKSFWRQVLLRLLDVTLTLSTCNLAFRGHRENVDSSSKGKLFEYY
ncbi:zinc finger MYM-type protein 5-like [Ctenocephalides felis]|uniref:zinc finger MYM-type protein 5-like n=1 Tax=Ctenocephalides felis TaxID=7515 RepID=UPI000E6E5956|nr:zinc finger MYM-type protein 5-like [Ctenocephalides felis]